MDSDKNRKSKKIISAGGIIFWKNGNQTMVCIVKRKGRDIWIFPRGRIEQNESMEHAVIREVREETGIISKVIRKIGVVNYSYYSSHEKVFYDKEVHFYLLKISKNEKFIPNQEIQEMKWVTVEEAYNMLSYPEEKELLSKALKYIL
ncbi:MAG: NUDIX hydrolase [bacterium]